MAGHTPGHVHGYVITTKDGKEIRRKADKVITQDTLRQIASLLGVSAADAANIGSITVGNLDESKLA